MPLSLSGTTGIVTGNIAALQVTTATIADANVTPGKLSQPMTLRTVQNATGSNTSFDFTGIPSWAKRITVMFGNVSTNGSNILTIQLGTSSGFVATGYLGAAVWGINGAAVTATANSTGFKIDNFGGPGNIRHGNATICFIGSNTWSFNSIIGLSDQAGVAYGGGSIPLGGVLDRVRIIANGIDTFDAGSVNILYEG